MIVFLNGPFGVGKTTVARRLVARLPRALYYDPDWAGFVLRRALPRRWCPPDYQDLDLWRRLTVLLPRLLRATSRRALVLPMTIWRPDPFAEIVGGLRAREPDFHHFTLTATAATLDARIRASGEAVDWRLAHAARCRTAFADPLFATQIATDGLTPDEVAARILAHLPARMVPAGRL